MCSKTVPDVGRDTPYDPFVGLETRPNSGQMKKDLRVRIDPPFLKPFHRASRLTILNPTSVARLIRSRISRDQEELWAIALSASKRILGIEMMFRGTADSCMVHPRDIVRFICETNATSYIVAHNHPSGELEPSEQDWVFTAKLVSCGELIEIPLIDHVVVTQKGHTSMATARPKVFKQSSALS
jgi:DNA repair protein RadC